MEDIDWPAVSAADVSQCSTRTPQHQPSDTSVTGICRVLCATRSAKCSMVPDCRSACRAPARIGRNHSVSLHSNPAQPDLRCSSSRGMISTKLHGRWRASSWNFRIPFHASRHAPVDPGKQKMNVPVRYAPACPRLDRRRTDLLKRQHVKQNGEAFDLFFEERLDRFRGDVAASKSGAAGRDHAIDRRIVDPAFDDASDEARVVFHQPAIGQNMPRFADRLLRKSPDVSSASVRESDMVRTAILTGMNVRSASMPAMKVPREL